MLAHSRSLLYVSTKALILALKFVVAQILVDQAALFVAWLYRGALELRMLARTTLSANPARRAVSSLINLDH